MNKLEEEWVEGKLCEDGFMKERFDNDKDELVRTLTPKGRTRALELLQEPENMRLSLELAWEKAGEVSPVDQIEVYKEIKSRLMSRVNGRRK